MRPESRRRVGRAAATLTLALSLGGATLVGAAVDVNGPWNVVIEVEHPFEYYIGCRLDLTQTGSAIAFAGSCDYLGDVQGSGSVDSDTGAFALSMGPNPFCQESSGTGSVAPDGLSFSAEWDCDHGTFTGSVNGSRCGNGIVDVGEDCDDGNQFGFDCCSASCHFEPAGQFCYDGTYSQCVERTCDGAGTCQHTDLSGPCDDGNSCTGADSCVAGACVGTTLPEGSACDDFNACSANDSCHSGYCYGDTEVTCDPCSYCDYYEGCVPYVSYYCQAPEEPKARLDLRDNSNPARDTLGWSWAPGSETSLLDFGDPRSRTDYALCVFDDYGDHLMLKAEAPAGGLCTGRACWKATRTGYRYVDHAGSPDGLRSITLRSGPAGKAAISVRGKGDDLDLGPLPVSTPLTVQLRNSDGACWGANYWTADVSTPFHFRARGGSPSAAFLNPTD